MRNKGLLVLEIIWIAVGIVCLVAGIRSAIEESGNQYIIFFSMVPVAFVFAMLRHRQRKKS